ncbi:acetyltransferase [Flavobacterium sp.]|uniref:acetyltransferase n=1 Tax=Flavobacterium sp. TaxID=239 RepID=UPI00261DC6C8|nr:acetyltransferase [Flavobacterium sp.]
METKVLLYGASGHGKVVLDILQAQGVSIDRICDDNPKFPHIHGISVVTTDTVDWEENYVMVFSIGNNAIRAALAQRYAGPFLTAIHPQAIVSPQSFLGEGSVVMAGSVINTDTRVGVHSIVNTGATLDHDCVIGDFVHISPGVSLAGNVTIGTGTHVGIGACVIQGVTIGQWCTIGAGAVILRDVPDYAVVVGNPGKIIKYNEAHV